MLWFLVSGWAFRIFFFSLWFLPFAGPLLINSLSKAAVVEVISLLASQTCYTKLQHLIGSVYISEFDCSSLY